ncbi:hypothetical protein H0E87_008115 [Populus deltoides]|uniref:chitinase n=1 Tax=Populus deltoides TaxID=3696 RepID=A0A8T2YZI9_POPDE|nr:hypothetical protein H0E87_008115 [Populus deltoides]
MSHARTSCAVAVLVSAVQQMLTVAQAVKANAIAASSQNHCLRRCYRIETMTAVLERDSIRRWIIGEDAPFTWGYCFVNELNPKSDYCDPNTNSSYPCAVGKHYYGRGAPSCHEVITGEWSPSEEDIKAGRKPGFGALTNIITNGSECTKDKETWEQNRIAYYLRYCDMLDVDPGENIDCDNQEPFEDNGLLKMVGTM